MRDLLPGGGTGEGCGQAERDQDAAGNIARGFRPARAGLQGAGDGAGEQRPEHVANNTHEGKQGAEEENLRGDFPAGRNHELRQEGEEEKSSLRIQDIYDDSLSENTTESCLSGSRGGERIFLTDFLYAEKDQVRGA